MAAVTIYTKTVCAYCVRAKNLFKSLGVAYDEINVDDDPELKAKIAAKYNWRTVPMILVGERFLGGFDDVNELHRQGGFLPLVAAASHGKADSSPDASLG